MLESLSVDTLALGVVFLQGTVLEGELLDFLTHQIVVCRGHFAVLVPFQDIHLPLQFIIFPVQEIDLALQFVHALLILLILVLQVNLLKILHGRVQIMKPEDLLVTDLDLAFQLLNELLIGGKALLHLAHHLIQLLASVISLSHFLRPLRLLSEDVLLDLHAHGDRSGARRIHFTVHADALLHGVGKFHALSLLEQIGFLLTVELTQTFNNLVLTWKVDTLQILLHLGFELYLLLLETSNSLIL